ncbi:hypothetical protein ABPG72_015539 [Tetrahymena utriculariae]
MSFQSFSTVCKDITNQQKFIFIDQNVQFLDSSKQMINITKSVSINNILSAFLRNCILFVKTQSGDLSIGCYPHSFAQQEVILQSNQISGYESQSIEFIYQRLSPEEIQRLFPRTNAQKEQKKNKNQSKKNMNKIFKESKVADDESISGSSTCCNFKKTKTESFAQNKYFQEDFLADFEAEQELHLQKRKISNISHSSQNISAQSSLSTTAAITCQINSTIQNNSKETNKLSQQQISILNHNLTRSKERTIASAIKIVSQWRDLYEKYKEERVFRDLQEVAEEIGLSKKVLDYYFLELRTAEFFGFDFDSNLEQKFGKIRKFNNSHKQQFIQKNSNKKIPINSNFNYRMNNQASNKQNVSGIQKPFKIININHSNIEFNNNEQQNQIQNDFCYQNQQNIYHPQQQQQQFQQQYQVYNIPTIHL